jgi:regulator of RNase E activity RraA
VGAVRDTAEMKEMGFPVFSRTVASGFMLGKIASLGFNVPVTVGGVPVRPGDIVMADNDGVVFIPPEHLEAVIDRAQAIERWESAVHALIAKGRSPDDAIAQVGPMP